METEPSHFAVDWPRKNRQLEAMHDDIQDAFSEVLVVGLFEFEDCESGGIWWIGLEHFSPECKGTWLEDCDGEEFQEMFEGTTCLETLPPYQADAALERARRLARERRLPLYRVTRFRDRQGDQHSVFELMCTKQSKG